jgi:hypothetical protein
MSNVIKVKFRKRKRLSSLLGLVLDGNRLEGVVVRRNGGFRQQHPFSVALSLDPLTADPVLVGREIRNQLDAQGVHERHCVVGLPLKWALIAQVDVPEMPEADVTSFLEIEAERGFPSDVTTLQVATSRLKLPSGKQLATLIGLPKNHLARLEQVLKAAKLKPASFSLGIPALQLPDAASSNGVLALAIGETSVDLQVSCGGGILTLRTIEGALEAEGSKRTVLNDVVAREIRITLGQMPAEVRDTLRKIRIYGPADQARQLASDLGSKFGPAGLAAEAVTRYSADELGAAAPADAAVTPAFSLAAAALIWRGGYMDLLPPKVTRWQQLSQRYASGKMRSSMLIAAFFALLVGSAFFYQQIQLWSLGKEWKGMEKKVGDIKKLQATINQYRPWFDESVKGLTIMRALTSAFPTRGTLTAKHVEIRELKTVSCDGIATAYQEPAMAIDRLSRIKQVTSIVRGPVRGTPPNLQFSFSFVWNDTGSHAN